MLLEAYQCSRFALALQYFCLQEPLKSDAARLTHRVCDLAQIEPVKKDRAATTVKQGTRKQLRAWNKLLTALSRALTARVRTDVTDELNCKKVMGELKICLELVEEVRACWH